MAGLYPCFVDLAIGLLGVNYYHEGPISYPAPVYPFVKPLGRNIRTSWRQKETPGDR